MKKEQILRERDIEIIYLTNKIFHYTLKNKGRAFPSLATKKSKPAPVFNRRKDMTRPSLAEHLRDSLYFPLFRRPWPLGAGAMAFALANVLMAAYARGLGVFPQMSMWGASIYNAIGIQTQAPFYPVTPVLSDIHSMINFGILLGVLGAALLSQEFKFRADSPSGYAQGFLGGVLMGFGTVLTPPCNVGGFGTAIMAFSLSGFLMAVGLVPGAYLGGRILLWQAVRSVSSLDLEKAAKKPGPPERSSGRQPLLGSLFFIFLFVAAGLYAALGKPKFSGLLLFGALFGIIFQRSRLCFASAFRDIFITRDTRLLRWIVISLVVGMAGFGILKSRGFVAADHFVFPAGIHTVVGGFIFGIGMVLAGGCGVGVLWRSAEGYIRHWFALLGGMLAAGAWVHIYGQQVGKGWLYGPKVFLPDFLGWFGASVVAILALAAFYLFLTWLEVRKSWVPLA